MTPQYFGDAKTHMLQVDAVTLVFQQFTVLESNLDYTINRFCGAMGTDPWSKGVWQKHFEQNMIIVCTAEVLKQCLFHSFLRMDQINLLVFDEAHHAKLNHPYAEIIRDHYVTEPDLAKRPRIFGMTASPVDANVDLTQAAEQLEMLLHSKIATTSSGSIGRHINHAEESTIRYHRLENEFETEFYQEMWGRFGSLAVLKRAFSTAKAVSKGLGAWASDMVWQIEMREEHAKKIQMKIERIQFAVQSNATTSQAVAMLDAETALLRDAVEFVSAHKLQAPTPDEGHLSSKVLTLYQKLAEYFSTPSSTRCLVFVTERMHARLLMKIFEQLKIPHLRPGTLTGRGKKDLSHMPMSLRQQVLTLSRFRDGEVNCLFATSIAEEGLDIPACNLVIRFDLYRTVIQYIQSKGRARHRNSKFINMCEAGNGLHEQTVRDAVHGADKVRHFCRNQSGDRLIRPQHLEDDVEAELLRDFIENRGPRYVDPRTGATLNYNTALTVLAYFVSMLPDVQNGTLLQPMYTLSADSGGYICDVVLPAAAPIRSAIGQVHGRKALAKRSAAFELCMLLLKGRFLDENLMPIYKKRLPALRNALLALNPHKSNSYKMRLKPAIWAQDRGSLPQMLYATVIDVDNGVGRPHDPLVLLTRAPLPTLPTFPLFLNSGTITQVRTVPLQRGFSVTTEELEQLTSTSLAVFADIFSKTFERKVENMSYWLAPLHVKTWEAGDQHDAHSLIDWNATFSVHRLQDSEYRWKWRKGHTTDDDLRGQFFIDPWDGGRRAFTVGVNRSLKPLDPVPEDCVTRKKHADTILAYSVSLWKKSRTRSEWMTDQPVVEAQQVLHRRNLLAPPEKTEEQMVSRAVLCPEPMLISALPTRFIAMCLVLPAIIHRIQDYLIALETCDLVGVDLSPVLALEALTKDSDNTGNHEEDQINFRSGMGNNYERLEFLGDCFLKMATTIAVFVVKPNNDEFFYHCERMGMLCNKNLFNTATQQLNLHEFVRSQAFSRRNWYPEGLLLLKGKGQGKAPNENHTHQLGDKTVADACEALIGAAFLQHDERGQFHAENWENAIKAVTKFVSHKTHSMTKWSDYFDAYEVPDYQTAHPTAVQRDLAAKVQSVNPYVFQHPTVLASAFNHPSCPPTWSRGLPSYQRLEFLGDALLEIAVVSYLFYKYPDKDPQWLTEHKMALVSNKFLGALCIELGFHRHLRHNLPETNGQITEFSEEIRDAKEKAKGSVDYWTFVKSPPKCLPDIVEAYLGAMFIDSDFNYQPMYDFFDLHILPFFIDMSIYDTFANHHPTTHLHTILSVNLGCRDYSLMSEEMPPAHPGAPSKVMAAVMIHSRVCVHAIAASSRYAKIAASKKAITLVDGLAPFEYKEKFHCDCKGAVEGEEADIGTAV